MVIFSALQEKFNYWFHRGGVNSHINTDSSESSDRAQADSAAGGIKKQKLDDSTAAIPTIIDTGSFSVDCNKGLENTNWDACAKKRKFGDVAWPKKCLATLGRSESCSRSRTDCMIQEVSGIRRAKSVMRNEKDESNDWKNALIGNEEINEQNRSQIGHDMDKQVKRYNSDLIASGSNSLVTNDDGTKRTDLGIISNLSELTMDKTHRLAEKSLFEKLIRSKCALGGKYLNASFRENVNRMDDNDTRMVKVQQQSTCAFNNTLNVNKTSVIPIQRESSSPLKSNSNDDDADKWYMWKLQECNMNTEINIVDDIKHSYSKCLEDRKLQIEEMKKQILEAQTERNRNYLVERIKTHLKIKQPDVEEEQEKEKEKKSIKEITSEMKKEMQGILRSIPKGEIVAQSKNATVRTSDLYTLIGNTWLNDEVINQYMGLITERCQGEYPKVYCFTTFFYERLIKMGYDAVKRWTKKFDIFENDMLLVPIHLSVHWCMVVIDFRKKQITYYDSMGSSNDKCLQNITTYLLNEHKNKKEKPFPIEGWKRINTKREIPQQSNGSDCGVFACTFAEYISRDAQFDFEQKNMPQIREKMMYEITVNRLLN